MIKLNRPECPIELSNLEQELLKKYDKNPNLQVWNDSRVKAPLKEALKQMSFEKCAYCECELNVESKDVTIDHFKPKSVYPALVIEWDNLFPACLRCNRSKGDKDELIINPCFDDPKEHLCLNSISTYRIKTKNNSPLGKTTIEVLNLNDIKRVMTPRMQTCEKLIDLLIELQNNINERGILNRFINKLENILDSATKENAYSATASAHILNHTSYLKIKEILLKANKWNTTLELLEDELKEIAFSFQ